jgi:hypothetical protein
MKSETHGCNFPKMEHRKQENPMHRTKAAPVNRFALLQTDEDSTSDESTSEEAPQVSKTTQNSGKRGKNQLQHTRAAQQQIRASPVQTTSQNKSVIDNGFQAPKRKQKPAGPRIKEKNIDGDSLLFSLTLPHLPSSPLLSLLVADAVRGDDEFLGSPGNSSRDCNIIGIRSPRCPPLRHRLSPVLRGIS